LKISNGLQLTRQMKVIINTRHSRNEEGTLFINSFKGEQKYWSIYVRPWSVDQENYAAKHRVSRSENCTFPLYNGSA